MKGVSSFFFLLLELQVCSVVIVRNWIWRGLPTPSMTSLITSVSDSLQICLLLLACCQSASQPVNQSTTQSGNFLLWVRQPAGLLLTTLAGGIGGRERGSERGGNIQGGGKTVSGTDKHIHANSLPFDCIKIQTRRQKHRQTHTYTGRRLIAVQPEEFDLYLNP